MGDSRLDCTVLVLLFAILLLLYNHVCRKDFCCLFFELRLLSYRRSTFATYILSLGGNRQNDRTRVKEIFLPVFSALVDAIVLRAQVTYWKLS